MGWISPWIILSELLLVPADLQLLNTDCQLMPVDPGDFFLCVKNVTLSHISDYTGTEGSSSVAPCLVLVLRFKFYLSIRIIRLA